MFNPGAIPNIYALMYFMHIPVVDSEPWKCKLHEQPKQNVKNCLKFCQVSIPRMMQAMQHHLCWEFAHFGKQHSLIKILNIRFDPAVDY